MGYSDGTLQITTGGVEVGQGLNTKVVQAVAMALSVPMASVSVQPTSTAVLSQQGATGGSVTSELCVAAALQACTELLALLAPFKLPSQSWTQLCAAAIAAGKDLRVLSRIIKAAPSPGPDSYQTWGVCISEVYLDVLTGEYQFLRNGKQSLIDLVLFSLCINHSAFN